MNERERAARLKVLQQVAETKMPITDEEVDALVARMSKQEVDEAVLELRSKLAVKHDSD